MEDYESQYQEYKNGLLSSPHFLKKFRELYSNTLSAEKDYLDKKGVLDKVGILSAIGGVFFGFFLIFEPTDQISSIIFRCILFIVGIVCFSIAINTASNYKNTSGKSNFYSFVYDKYILDRIREDKQRATDALLRDMINKLDNIQWRAEALEEGSKQDAAQLQSDLLYVILRPDDFQKRLNNLSRYDRYAEDILEDYYFSKSIHEHIE